MATRKATYTPAVTPRVGILVTLDSKPGLWQIASQAPGHGSWWLAAYDAAAKAHKSFEQASARDMSRPSPATAR